MTIAICTPIGKEMHHRTAQCRNALVESIRASARAQASREATFGLGGQTHEDREALAQKYGAVVIEVAGKPVDKARNEITAAALKMPDVTHLLWIDADMIFKPDSFARLLSYKLPVVGGLYYGRRAPWFPIILRNHAKDAKLTSNSCGYIYDHPINKVIEVDGTGGGFLLTAREVYEGMKQGEWWTEANGESEDISFCRRVQNAGHRIYVDTGLELGHFGEIEVYPSWGRKHRDHQHNVWIPDVDLKTAGEREAAVSVVVVAKDAPVAAIQATIAMIENQTLAAEIILVDNASELPVSSVLSVSKGHKFHRLDTPHTMGDALNYGAELASTDWISFCSPGDVWQPNRNERCIYAAFASECRAITHNMDVTFGNGSAWMTPDLPKWNSLEESQKALSARPVIPLSAMFINKALFYDVGDFNTSLQHCAPWEYVIRTSEKNIWYQIPETLGVRRTRDDFVTEEQHNEVVRMLSKFPFSGVKLVESEQ